MKRTMYVPICLLLLSLLCSAGIAIKYSTTIPFKEAPISEGSAWTNGHQVGLSWADVATYSGKAWGKEGMQTQAGYSDATAVLKGVWNSSQGVAAKVFVTSGAPGAGYPCYPEVELRLHTGIAPYSIKGYEVNFAVGATSKAYSMIVRWNGALGNFTVLKTGYGSSYGVKNGDTVSATYTFTTRIVPAALATTTLTGSPASRRLSDSVFSLDLSGAVGRNRAPRRNHEWMAAMQIFSA
jgi:hypothetical protein